MFLLCKEGLLTLMKLAHRDRLIKGVKTCRREPILTHLMFVDNCLLFGQATLKEVNVLTKVLRKYENISGQCVNFGKYTTFFSSNTSSLIQDGISQRMQIRVSIEPKKISELT